MTHAELNTKVTNFSHYLRDQSLENRRISGVLLEREDMILPIGILKAEESMYQ
jgi:hypothetical protein